MRARNVTTLAKRVADAAHGVDEARRAAVLRLAAEVPDVDVEGVRRRAEVVAPDPLEDDRARQHLARVPEEQLEQRELGARELDRTTPAPHLARPEIELEIREAQHVRGLVAIRRASEQRAQPREQLRERERLREVVVRSRVEAGDAAVDLGARGQHEHRHRIAVRPEAVGTPRARRCPA